MDSTQIKEHWLKLATQFKTDLKATTHTDTIKKLEIHALYLAIKRAGMDRAAADVLEIGCGNGYNCLSLAELLPHFNFTGLDYVLDMVENAKKLQLDLPALSSRINFQVGDVLHLADHKGIKNQYDIVFTDRCLINLNTTALQLAAFDQLAAKVKKGGYLLILENSERNYRRQNDCREAVGLPRRTPAEYNLFIDEEAFLGHAKKLLKLIHVDDFGSLHDIILYVLVPMINGGTVDYKHPMVKAAAQLSVSISDQYGNAFGDFGQNRLFVFHKL
jgi:SAM-dependent methyltransferase